MQEQAKGLPIELGQCAADRIDGVGHDLRRDRAHELVGHRCLVVVNLLETTAVPGQP